MGVLSSGAIPFFDRFQTLEAVLQFLATTKSNDDRSIWPGDGVVGFGYAAALAASLGREQEMQDYLEKAMVAARRCRVDGMEEIMSKLGDRLRACLQINFFEPNGVT